METKLCRMNSTAQSSTNTTTNNPLNNEQSDGQSSYVQSDTIISPDLMSNSNLLLDSSSCSSLAVDHQTSLPCTSGEKNNRNEFENTDLEFGDQYTNLSTTTFSPLNTATTSLSSSSNNLLDKVDKNSTHTTALSSSCSSPSIGNAIQNDSNLITHHDNPSTQLNTPPPSKSPSKSPDHLETNSNKLSVNVADLTVNVESLLNQQMNVDQLRERFNEQFNQQIFEQQINDESMSDDDQSDDECSEDCSSEEEKSLTNTNSKKRSRSPHSCSKRRKQSNPVRCDFEKEKTPINLEQLNKLNQQLKKLSEQNNVERNSIERNELINVKNLESLHNQLRKFENFKGNNIKKSDEDEPEEGLIRKFPNTLSAAANAVARFLLSNHQTGNYVDSINSNSKSSDNGESQINYTYYLAAAAAVATNASKRGTKHCLNYCKECCCPFLSTEHERLYRQLEGEKNNKSTHDQSTSPVFSQQTQNIDPQSKLLQEIESVFEGSYEIGQVPQRNAIDAMQLIKQLESGQLDNEEAKIYQQQLVSLLNSNIFEASSNSNQVTNSLSALLTGRVFNRDAYCTICSKEFCNKYFLKTHLAKKHSIQDNQQQSSDNKCISPITNPVQLLDEYSGLLNTSTGQIVNSEAYCEICRKSFCNKYFLKTHKQKVHHENVDNSTNQKSPVSSSPKQDQSTINPQQQLQYELINAIASEQHQQEDANATTVSNSTVALANEQQQKDAIRTQLSLQQMLTNPSQWQQLTAVMACESFANILRNSIVQPNSSELSTADLAQLVNSTNTNFLFTPERLREMGVVNVEAFCRICLKEFCNKYFLKTHMANKHHIHTEDDCGSSSCDSQANNDQNANDKSNRANNSKSDMCNLDDDALEPGQCPSTFNPMDFSTLFMINNIKQQQLNNNQANKEQANLNKDESSSVSSKTLICDLCSKALPSNYHLKMHRFYSHQIPFAKEDDVRCDEKSEQIDRNNNSNEDVANVVQKELTNEGVELNQQQATILEFQNEGLLKFQQMLKELQQHPENDLDTEVLKKLALLHKQQQQQTNIAKLNEENSIYCDYCEKEFKTRSALRGHNCAGNENRLADSPNSMFSNLSAQMANTVLNNSNNSTLNYALNGEAESLVNQTGNAANLNISSNGRDVLNSNPLLNLNSSNQNQTNSNRLSPVNSLSQSNQLLANLTQGLPQGLPSDVTNSIFYSSTAGITLDLNKQPKFVAGRNYCNLCNKELCNKYFMKTHMMKMHNINIDEHPAEAAANSIVGGVMCDICQKELCSKYFLKVHKQNTHGIYEDGGIPVTNQQLITPNSTGIQSSSLSSSLVSTQSNLSPNACGLSATNGLINRSNVANTLSPLFSSVYEPNLSKEQLQQLQLEFSKQSQLLKNGNSAQASFLDHQKSSTPVSFNANNSNNSNPQQTPSPNVANNNGQSNTDRNEKELFYLQGIDPGDTSNRYFNQYTEVCPYCKRRFKSIKWMKTHLFNEHQNLISTQSPSNKNSKQTEQSPDKIRCIFCAKLFNDNVNLHLHLVSDHRSSLEEMILARNMEIASNFGTDESLSFTKTTDKEDSATRKSSSNNNSSNTSNNNESNKNETLLSELFSQQQKKQAINSPTIETKVNQIKHAEETNSELSDQEESAVKEKSQTNISNILQMMQKKQNENNDLSGDDEQFDEEDDESLSEEEKFAAMLNNAQLQKLLLNSTKSSNTNNTTAQPSTSANSKIMNLYEELIGQQSHQERSEQNLSPSNGNQQIDDQPDSEISDYERFSRALQQQQLLQQLQHDKLSNKLIQQQQVRKRPNAVYTKLYQCHICEYNTRWLSNLYAHEKRRHNTCSSSQGNLKVITMRRDIPSPNSNVLNSSPFRSNNQMNLNTQMSLNSLLNGLENGGNTKLTSNQQSNNPVESDLMSQLNDFNNNQNLSNSFVNQLLQSGEASKVARPVKERTASGDGKYICTICGRTYRHKHSLQRHLVCHREGGNSSLVNKVNQDNQSNVAMITSNVKNEQQHQSSPQSNDLNNSNLLFTRPSNGTSTPSFNSSTGRSSSVDSVISGEHNIKQQSSTNSQTNQLANQMFDGLNQEMLESLISGSNSSFLGNLITGNASNIHSLNNASTYSNSTASDNSATATATNSTAMFSV